ncbi:MAG TPA: hypothetical protein VNT50_06825 [Microbacterium sp.]|uniref:hypothetical protein n=1 Tax=Microbacterium sp. TaxID=51671 RepID=UPI002C8A86A7|nr:hypothetical protein [Microbacterium sp.]HWI31185.1 hypothetical protein [Microbacterium sp.]
MNDTLSAVRSRDQNRLHLHLPTLPASGARLSFADRASLRLGVWLLLRSTRSAQQPAAHERHHRHLVNERARLAREHIAAREQLLWTVRA